MHEVSALSLVSSVLGVRPEGRDAVAVDPVRPWTFGATRISVLGTRGRPVDIEVSADGSARAGAPPGRA